MMGDGRHLLVDGLAPAEVPKLTIEVFLEAAPDVIGMTPIAPLLLVKTELGFWQGFQVIAESHIAVHTKYRHVHADVFSCKPFEIKATLDFIVDHFCLTNYRWENIHRTWLAEAVPV